jgi:hypothetical protein
MGVILIILSGFYFTTVWPISMPILRNKVPTTQFPEVLPTPRSDPTTRMAFSVVIIIVIVILAGAGAFLYFTAPQPKKDENGGGQQFSDPNELPRIVDSFVENGYTDENSEEFVYFTLNQTDYVYDIYLILEWYDESDETRRHENQPDEFMIYIDSSHGYWESQWVSNDQSSKHGIIEFTIGPFEPPLGWEEPGGNYNEWMIGVVCGECGNHEARNFGLLSFTDSGNFWQITVMIDYCFEPEELK